MVVQLKSFALYCDLEKSESETLPGIIPLSLFTGVSARGGGLAVTEPVEKMQIMLKHVQHHQHDVIKAVNALPFLSELKGSHEDTWETIWGEKTTGYSERKLQVWLDFT